MSMNTGNCHPYNGCFSLDLPSSERALGNTRAYMRTLLVILISIGLFACASLLAVLETSGSVIEGKNLLRNASFLQSTNRSIPDYWDLHHAAAVAFRDLHNQYFISDTVASPVAHTKTLVIVNNVKDFYHAIVLPRIFFQKLPKGNYTFSVYAKSESGNAELLICRAWGDEKPTKKILTKQWERYAVTFSVGNSTPNPPQPMLYFPGNAMYFISAPQLEYGSSATDFRPSPEDSTPGTSLDGSVRHGIDMNFNYTKVLKARREAALIGASFKYDYYTDEDFATLEINSRYASDLNVHVVCPDKTESAGIQSFSYDGILSRAHSTRIRVPLSVFAIGKHTCTVSTNHKTIKRLSVPVVLNRIADSPHRVRVMNRRYLVINNAAFFIIGMEVGGRDNLPDWYFDDLTAHGINTLFFGAMRNGRGAYDLTQINNFLAKANRHGFKVVIGRPLMGNKDPDWRQKISAFKELIEKLKNNPAIIAWEPVDEPAANTWLDSELLEIYNNIKQIDPYRPIFMNWAYDGVPATIGEQPRGTLKATDFYSIDYYPFAGQERTMHDFTQYSVRALETGRLFNKIPHSWIQLYGGMDAWREPGGDELNYMVYLNLIYGSMFSYWDTKSNSSITWNRVAEINRQAKTLATNLFLDPNARETRLPEIDGNFIFSIWETGKDFYVVALHNGQGTETMDFDLSGLVGSKVFSVRSLFENRKIVVAGKRIKELFSPYQSRVYVVTAER
jgi:hypothetical protein